MEIKPFQLKLYALKKTKKTEHLTRFLKKNKKKKQLLFSLVTLMQTPGWGNCSDILFSILILLSSAQLRVLTLPQCLHAN